MRSCDKCRDNFSQVACIDGTIYGPCDSEYCSNPCDPYYDCDCECHEGAE